MADDSGRWSGSPIWTRKRIGHWLSITVSPFEPLSEEKQAAIDSKAQDIGRFFDTEAGWGTAFETR